LNQEKETIS